MYKYELAIMGVGMNMIAVIDYEMENLRNVSKALEVVGAEVEITSKPEVIARAEAVVLPGVGAFHRGMENLKRPVVSYPQSLRL